MIEAATSLPNAGWLALRKQLWPHGTEDQHLAEMTSFVANPHRFAQYMACSDAGEPLGFAEASIRHDYVNGTDGPPVAFLEGIYVVPNARRKGIARALVAAVSEWAAANGIFELASDTLLANEDSQAVHKALGFRETERVVFFRKPLS